MTIKDTKTPSVIFITKSKLQFFSKNLTAVLNLDWPAGSVQDLEIKKPDDFATSIKTFVEQNKLSPNEIVTIIGDDLCIQKEFNITDKKDFDEGEIQKFLDTAPFDYIHSKTYKLGKTNKVIIVNRDFYETIQENFIKLGFAIGPTLLRNFPGASIVSDSLTVDFYKKLVAKSEYLHQNAFVGPSRALTDATSHEENVKNHRNTIILLAIMGLLIAILAILIVTIKPFTPPPKKQTIPSASTVVKETQAPQVQVVPTTNSGPEATVSAELIKISIVNASGVSGRADILKKALLASGFVQTTTGNSKSQSAKSSLIYKSTVLPITLSKITGIVKDSYPTVLVQQDNTITTDVAITLGNDKVATSSAP